MAVIDRRQVKASNWNTLVPKTKKNTHLHTLTYVILCFTHFSDNSKQDAATADINRKKK